MARAIWSGTISFGLVSVPVRMFPATQSQELRFHFVDRRDLTPIGYEKVRKDDGESVPAEEIVRGFEIDKGRYVPLEDEDLDRLDIELTHSIDICDFVDLGEIDPIYFRRAYYLAPQEGAEKPYRLLVRALAETGKVGIAKSLVENLSESFKPEKYDDNYRKELLQLIRKKAKGQKLPEPQEEEDAEVVDLMAALRESVERTRKQTKKKPTRRARKAS